MNQKLFIGFLATILSFNSLAQISNVLGADNTIIRSKKYEDIKGSAYLFTDWSEGSIVNISGKEFTNVLIKYDTYRDLIELSQEGQTLEINSLNYPKFYIERTNPSTGVRKKYIFSANYQIKGYEKINYFEQLFVGKNQFLKKYKTVFTEDNVSGYGTSGSQKSFQLSVLYFVLHNNEAFEVKLNKKSFFQVFSDQADKAESYINSNGLKMKSEEDWILVLIHLENF